MTFANTPSPPRNTTFTFVSEITNMGVGQTRVEHHAKIADTVIDDLMALKTP
ncbi:MAG: hypothetical protein IH841_08535 [Thaumarchaeota archaeon]|nr:hypothetical protein [Nitrososphaerota archaeon]